jgi:hypothetical protein
MDIRKETLVEEEPEAHAQEETFHRKRPPLQPWQQPGLDPHGADKFLEHPRSVVWDDPETQKKWEALIKELEAEGHLEP